jgi:hypothetical protein
MMNEMNAESIGMTIANLSNTKITNKNMTMTMTTMTNATQSGTPVHTEWCQKFL